MSGEYVEGNCDIHAFEMADDTCRSCGRIFCSDCLVYSFGPKKPPFCLNCAIGAAGVRSNASRGKVASKRQLKKAGKARKREAKAAKKMPAPEPEPVTSPSDWVSENEPEAAAEAPAEAAEPAAEPIAEPVEKEIPPATIPEPEEESSGLQARMARLKR